MLTHIGEKPYQCSECIKDVSKNNDLTRHLNAHSEEKTYRCNQCRNECFHRIKCISKHILGINYINLQNIRKYIIWMSCSQFDKAFTTKVILKATWQHTLGKTHISATNAGRVFHSIINLNFISKHIMGINHINLQDIWKYILWKSYITVVNVTRLSQQWIS